MSEPQAPVKLTPAFALALWRRALEEEIGIGFECTDIEKARPLMYNARKSTGSHVLDEIMLCVSPGAKEIWLVRKSVEIPE